MHTIFRFSLLSLFILALSGCETTQTNNQNQQWAKALQRFEFEGMKLGDPPTILKKFNNVKIAPVAITRDPRITVAEIYQPNAFVSLAVAYFHQNQLYKLELRYFDGGDIHSLTKAGGWAFLRDYLIKRFGPPTQSGPQVRPETDQKGINPVYAKANLQWLFPSVQRKLNYLAMYDKGAGVALVTFTDLQGLARLNESTTAGIVKSSGQPGF